MKSLALALLALVASPALAVVLEEAPGAMPITPVMPPRNYPASDTADAVNQLKQEQQPRTGGMKSGRPFPSHEQPDLSNAEAAGVRTKRPSRPAPKKAKAKPAARKSPPKKTKKKR